jgi:hypothetical protein
MLGGPVAADSGAVGGRSKPITSPGAPGLSLGSPYEGILAAESPSAQRATLATMAAAGTKWLRLDVFLSGVSGVPGVYTWYFDPLFKAVTASGMHIDAMIYAPPLWATSSVGEPVPSIYAQLFAKVATHLQGLGVNTFEVWNEPNVQQSWGKAFSPKQYASLVEATYRAVKKVDPTSTVVLGGLAPASSSQDGTSIAPLAFFRALYAAGIKGYFDAAADHPYTFPNLPLPASSPFDPFNYLLQMHATMVQYGDGSKRIWLTEFGAPTGENSQAVSRSAQAVMISQAFGWAEARPWIGPLFIFSWEDTAVDGEFGLYTRGGAAKPAAAVYARAAREWAESS